MFRHTHIRVLVIALCIVSSIILAILILHKNNTLESTKSTSKNDHQTNTQSQTTQAEQSTHSNSSSSSNGVSSETTTDYQVIKEWGVRFKLPKDLVGNIRYKLESDTQIQFDGKSFPEGADCVSFYLIRTGEPTKEQVFTTIDGYHYLRSKGIIACSNDNSVNDRALAYQNELYDSVLTLEKDK